MQPPRSVRSLAGFGFVVLGSAVYLGSWLKEAQQLADRFRGDLVDHRLWLFSSGPVGSRLVPAAQHEDLTDLVRRTGALEHQLFSGRIDPAVLGLGERLAVRTIKLAPGDYRDPALVEAWAATIADTLARDAAAVSGQADLT